MTKEKIERVQLWTPPGRVSFPYFAAPDTGREYSTNAYSGDLLIPKPIFKEKGQALQDAVIKVGKEAFGKNFKLVGGTHRTPFKDTDTDEKIENEQMKNSILIRAKSGPRKGDKPAIQPMFIGPRKVDGKFVELSKEQIAAIKGGDWCLFQVTVFAYKQQGGGVTLALNAVQFWKQGDAFGQGRSKLLETAEELEQEELEEADDATASGSDDDAEEQGMSVI